VEDGVRQSVTLLFDAYRLDLLRQAIERAEAKEGVVRSTGTPSRIF
jgi:hypothetical protein